MRRVGALVLALALVAGPACGGDDGIDDPAPEAATPGPGGTATTAASGPGTAASAGASAADLCAGARLAAHAPTVAPAGLTEVSGLAASRAHPGVLWAHNDSGGDPEVFALGIDGSDRGRFTLRGAEAVDWEDMARAPGPAGGGDVLYLADIGDNDAEREGVTVYRVAEPDPAGQAAGAVLPGVEALAMTYADGPRNAEALLADPVSGDLFVVEKDLAGGSVPVYRIPAGTAAGTPVVMEAAGDAALPPGEIVTGGDVSADGSLVALRTYASVLLWDRAPGESVPDALAGEPCRAVTPVERQGEAIAFTADGRGYTTVGEGEHRPVNTVRLG